MAYIVGVASREFDLYHRFKAFVTGVGFIGRAYYTGSGNGKIRDLRCPSLAHLGESYTLTCNSPAVRGGSFGVVSSQRGTLPDYELNRVYVDERAQFYADFGTADFAVNDTITLKFAEYSQAGKPKLSALTPKIGTVTEQIILTCTSAGVHLIPGSQAEIPAQFTVSGNVSGAMGTYQQGQPFSNAKIGFTLDRGDVTSAGAQFAISDTIVIHTTQSPVKAEGVEWEILREPDGALTEQFGYTVPASDSEILLKGKGVAGVDEIFVGIRRSWSTAAAAAYWQLTGSRGYAPGLTYDEQPVMLPSSRRPFLSMWSGDLPYWISVTGRKITMMIRNNTYYASMYLGLGIPWGSPKNQSYFLVVGGSNGARYPEWTNLAPDNSNYWGARGDDYNYSSCQALWRDGSWRGHLVRQSNDRGQSWNAVQIDSHGQGIWPYRGNGMREIRENLDGSTAMLPVTLYPTLGEIDGVYAISGYGGIQPEDLVYQAATGKRYVAGINTYRNSTEDFHAMELI